MDITCRHILDSNKLTTFKQIDSQIAAVLIACGLASQYHPPAPPPEVQTWCVAHPPYAPDKWVILWSGNTGERTYFTSEPAIYLKNPPKYGGAECPASVLEQYARLRGVPLDPDWVKEKWQREKDADFLRQQKEQGQSHQWRG